MLLFFFKQKSAYEMRISDWSSDVCSSDLVWAAQADCQAIGRQQTAMQMPDPGSPGSQGVYQSQGSAGLSKSAGTIGCAHGTGTIRFRTQLVPVVAPLRSGISEDRPFVHERS